MTLTQGTESETSVVFSGTARPLPQVVMLLVFATPTLVHVARAVLVRDATAQAWLERRGFIATPALLAEVRRFLRRFRWTRAAASACFLLAAWLLITQLSVPLGIVAAPYLLALLLVEATAPSPRRGRTRTASLVVRPRDYFAPYRSLRLARALIALGALTSVVAALVGPSARLAVAHGVVLCLGLLVLEAALAVGARRALPEATEALALDTAMRVQAARTTVAAATVFGGVGFWYSTALLGSSAVSGGTALVVGLVLATAAQLLTYVAVGVAITLAAPLERWQPRTAT